jgi:hypothetical protein
MQSSLPLFFRLEALNPLASSFASMLMLSCQVIIENLEYIL